MKHTKHLVVLSGPSCVGKSPLIAAVRRFYPEINFVQAVVIKSKESRFGRPRPDELAVWDNPDCWRDMPQIERLKDDRRYIVDYCYGFAQAIDLDKIINSPADIVLMESYYTMAAKIVQSDYLKDVGITTVFLSPLSRDEINGLGNNLKFAIECLMTFKQYRRALFHGRRIDSAWLCDIRKRVADSVVEISKADSYNHMLVNHCGEGSSDWNRGNDGKFFGRPAGDAGLAVEKLAEILSGLK